MAPANALQTVRTYLSRLRKLLADGDGSMLERGSAGYRLAADAVEVDVDGFDALRETRARRLRMARLPTPSRC